MVVEDVREIPIIRNVLPHTGRLDGDDTGYRGVATHPLDDEDPDPLIAINAIVPCSPIYAHGRTPRITPYYEAGLGASPTVLVRRPVALALVAAHRELERYGRGLLVLDGWRSAVVQARLWAQIFRRLLRAEGRATVAELSVADWIRLGRTADDTASFCRIKRDDVFQERIERLYNGPSWSAFEEFAASSRTDIAQLAAEYLTFVVNLEGDIERLDIEANTAHGSGGACDVWMVDLADGSPVHLGVPFDSTAPPAVMDYFEWAEREQYEEHIAADAGLSTYISEFGGQPGRVDDETFLRIRRERRTLFHTMMRAGATYFSLGRDAGEPWHFNFGNEREGRQSGILMGAGNACHSLLKNICDPISGKWIAVWGNRAAHRLAAQILTPHATIP